jgi:retron-type reverse transcriptase
MDEERDLLLVAVFTTLTIFLWVFFELVKTSKTSSIATPLQQVVSPLTSKIEVEVIDELEKRSTLD